MIRNDANRPTQVNPHEDDEPETPVATQRRQTQPIPHSPPPSFHSRASSLLERDREHRVDPDLANAFDDDDESDDDADDRQRLVRGNSFPIDTPTGSVPAMRTPPAQRPASQVVPPSVGGGSQATSRIYGGGIQSDGVFSNLTAKPERTEGEKEEQPPVRKIKTAWHAAFRIPPCS